MAQMRSLICFFQRQRGLEGSFLHVLFFLVFGLGWLLQDNLNRINWWYDKQIFEGILIARGNVKGVDILTFRDSGMTVKYFPLLRTVVTASSTTSRVIHPSENSGGPYRAK